MSFDPSGTVALADSVQAELVADAYISTAYAARTASAMVPVDFIQGSLVKSYPRLGKLTAGALVELTDASATALSDTQVSITLAEVGIGWSLTDLAKMGTTVGNIGGAGNDLMAKAYVDKIELLLLALTASLTDSVGSSGQAFTEDLFFQALYEAEANDCIGASFAYILFPKQWHQIRIAVSGVTENNSVTWGRSDMFEAPRPANIMGYKTTVDGVPVFISSNVPFVNGTTDSGGGLIGVGDMCPFKRVVGMLDGQPWDGRLEYQRDASFRATEAWVTGATAVGVPAPDRGCRILSVR